MAPPKKLLHPVRFALRLPRDLMDRLKSDAKRTNVSLNDLIISRLNDEGGSFVTAGVSLPPPQPAPTRAKREPESVPKIEGVIPAFSICAHKDYRIVNGGWRVCNDCQKSSPDSGRTWR